MLEREEIIMSVNEDGKHLVHLPSVFDKSKKSKKTCEHEPQVLQESPVYALFTSAV